MVGGNSRQGARVHPVIEVPEIEVPAIEVLKREGSSGG